MRQKFVFTTAIAVCLSLALVPAFANERTVDRYGDSAKTSKVRGANGFEVPETAELAQRIPMDSRLSGSTNATEKASALVAAAAKSDGNQAISMLQQVVTMELPAGDQSDKILSSAHELLAVAYEGTPSKQVLHLGQALQFASDAARRAALETQITDLGGDVFAVAFQQNNQNAYAAQDAGDDTCADAVAVSLNHSENMSIAFPGDHNWRSFDITGTGGIIRAETIPTAATLNDDTDLALYAGPCPGTQIAFDDDGGTGFASRIDTGCLVPGTYYVEVGGFFDSATPNDFDLEIELVDTCVPPAPDSFEPDDDRADAGEIGLPTATSGNGWGRAKKEIQGRSVFPPGDVDHATARLTQNSLVRMSTAGTHPTFFNDFASTAPTDNPDTILTLLFENEPDYGGRCNNQDNGFLPVCFSDADCPPSPNPIPGLPDCVPIQLFNVPVDFENPLATNDDRGGGDFGSELLMCLPRTQTGSPSLTLQAGGGDWLVRVSPFSASDEFDYELQVKNEVGCLFEQEPNNDFADATPYAIGSVVAGIYDFSVTNPFSDSDLYQWDVDAESDVAFQTFAPDSLQSDTAFELFVGPDDAGDYFNTGITDDDGGSGFLSGLALTVPPASDLLGNTTADADYFLNVTSFFYNPNFYYELASAFIAGAASTESEPNDSLETGNTINIGDTISGNIDSSCDVDTYRFELQQNTFVTLSTPSGGDSAINLVECGSGAALSCDDDSAGNMLPMIDGCLPAGQYCAQIRAFSAGDTFAYDLQLNGTPGCDATNPPSMSGDNSFTCLDFDSCN